MKKVKADNLLKFFTKIFLLITLLYIITNNFFTINLTPSLETGLYFVLPVNKNDLKVEDIVLFSMPEEIDRFVHERGYITDNCHTFIKKIGALENDRVEIKDKRLYVNNKFIGEVKDSDILGRPLPQIKSFTVPKDYFFPLGTHKKSFDGRYYGKINMELIEKKAFLLLSFEKYLFKKKNML